MTGYGDGGSDLPATEREDDAAAAAPQTAAEHLVTDDERRREESRYRRLWRSAVAVTLSVALAPLVLMLAVNHWLEQTSAENQIRSDLTRVLSDTTRSLSFVIRERLSALQFLVEDKGYAGLDEPAVLAATHRHLKSAFGGFVDLGIIDDDGVQRHYVGPYALEGHDYREDPWFHGAVLQGTFVSNVFLGHRDYPHFVIAVRGEREDDRPFVLRATLDMDLIAKLVALQNRRGADEVFLVDAEGTLQTPTRTLGGALQQSPLPVPPYSPEIELSEETCLDRPVILGYSYIEGSPFILLAIETIHRGPSSWIRTSPALLVFFAISAVLILIVVFWSASLLVRQIRIADERRAQMFHSIEYTNKMATIGRLAASVAHEINNPLAIINEKAGLLGDMVEATPSWPHRERVKGVLESIGKSVGRCSAVTQRLLGFTRRMEPRREMLGLAELLREVFGFLGKETEHRNIEVSFDIAPDLPSIESDRGQLQQVFLNILNNAIAAVSTGGKIEIGAAPLAANRVEVWIRDDGCGISEENVKHIFEPFFSTKGDFGTGLGLSITYGIVKRLGGEIRVQSGEGVGTTFTVRLPVKAEGRAG
jgi:signal transduction histidine kinase